jgi:hypothetical protein
MPVWQRINLISAGAGAGIAAMHSSRASAAIVVRKGEPISDSTVVGVVTKERIADAMIDAIDLFTD